MDIENKFDDFRFEINTSLNDMMIEMLLIRQMMTDFKQTKKKLKLLKEHYEFLKENFVKEFRKLNKDKLEEFKELLED